MTLPIHAIREIAEHTVRIYNLHIKKNAKFSFFGGGGGLLPFTLLYNSKQFNHTSSTAAFLKGDSLV